MCRSGDSQTFLGSSVLEHFCREAFISAKVAHDDFCTAPPESTPSWERKEDLNDVFSSGHRNLAAKATGGARARLCRTTFAICNEGRLPYLGPT